jgi:hypothetical protein
MPEIWPSVLLSAVAIAMSVAAAILTVLTVRRDNASLREEQARREVRRRHAERCPL